VSTGLVVTAPFLSQGIHSPGSKNFSLVRRGELEWACPLDKCVVTTKFLHRSGNSETLFLSYARSDTRL
jgi:hypothetical protein